MFPIGGIFELVSTVLVVVTCGGLYLLPTIIAMSRKKSNVVPIALGNVFLGWTVIGWAVMLMEAMNNE